MYNPGKKKMFILRNTYELAIKKSILVCLCLCVFEVNAVNNNESSKNLYFCFHFLPLIVIPIKSVSSARKRLSISNDTYNKVKLFVFLLIEMALLALLHVLFDHHEIVT